MPDCRKSHLIFQNFLGETPQIPRRRSRLRRSVRGFAPLPGPLSKIPGCAPDTYNCAENFVSAVGPRVFSAGGSEVEATPLVLVRNFNGSRQEP